MDEDGKEGEDEEGDGRKEEIEEEEGKKIRRRGRKRHREGK